MTTPLDSQRFRDVLGQYPTGVCIVTATQPDGTPVGMTVGSFTSVSLDPPLVAFLPDQRSSSWAKIRPAGAFCVNVLGAQQESVCRAFASKAEDKFAGIGWRSAPSGSPILHEAVAWIDCTVRDVLEAGDHHIVLGEVLDLDIGAPSLPLLFFRGGYGRFSPSSFAVIADDLLGQLPTIDLIRPAMESLAADLDVECNAALVAGEQFVYVARAGKAASITIQTRVGRRLPFQPPVGAPLVAWGDRRQQDAWLARAVHADAWTAELGHDFLDRIKDRGYAVGRGHEVHDRLWSTLIELDPGERYASVQELMDDLRDGYDQRDLDEDTPHEIAVMSAPVFDADAMPFVQLTLYGLPAIMIGADVRRFGDRLLACSREATHAVAGQTPPR